MIVTQPFARSKSEPPPTSLDAKCTPKRLAAKRYKPENHAVSSIMVLSCKTAANLTSSALALGVRTFRDVANIEQRSPGVPVVERRSRGVAIVERRSPNTAIVERRIRDAPDIKRRRGPGDVAIVER